MATSQGILGMRRLCHPTTRCASAKILRFPLWSWWLTRSHGSWQLLHMFRLLLYVSLIENSIQHRALYVQEHVFYPTIPLLQRRNTAFIPMLERQWFSTVELGKRARWCFSGVGKQPLSSSYTQKGIFMGKQARILQAYTRLRLLS